MKARALGVMRVTQHDPVHLRREVSRVRRADARTDTCARDAAWRRTNVKLRRLARRRSFVADLVVVGLERLLDRLLKEDSPAAASADTLGGVP